MDYYRSLILDSTKPLDFLQRFSDYQIFQWLSNEIVNGKKKLKYNSVDFIILKILNRNERMINFRAYEHLDLYVIGTFRSSFIPIAKMADALSGFYLEMKIMPNIIPIQKSHLLQDSAFYKKKLRNGIIIYDREGSLH